MDLVSLLVWLAVLVIVVLVAYWVLNQLPLDPMAKQIITICFVVVVAIIAIGILLRMSGSTIVHLP